MYRHGQPIYYRDPINPNILHEAGYVSDGLKDGQTILNLDDGHWCYELDVVPHGKVQEVRVRKEYLHTQNKDTAIIEGSLLVEADTRKAAESKVEAWMIEAEKGRPLQTIDPRIAWNDDPATWDEDSEADGKWDYVDCSFGVVSEG